MSRDVVGLVSELLRHAHEEVVGIFSDVRTKSRLIRRLHACVTALGGALGKLPKDTPWEVAQEVIGLLKNMKKFVRCFQVRDPPVHDVLRPTSMVRISFAGSGMVSEIRCPPARKHCHRRRAG